jgi:putative membrane protein
MRKLSNLLSGLFLILVFFVSITFTYFNSTPIIIRFGNWQVTQLPASVWIIGAFVSGGLLGLLLGLRFFSGLRSKHEIRRLNKKLHAAKLEVEQLRSLSAKSLKR